MEFTLNFIKLFLFGVSVAGPILLSMGFIIVVLGLIVGKNESWTRFEAVYWAFVTSTTLGYGDLRPVKKISRIFSILIAFTGIILSGIMVAIALYAATESFKVTNDIDVVKASVQTHLK